MGGSVRDCLWSIIIITCVGESVSSLAKNRNRREKNVGSRSGDEMKEQKGMKLWTIVVSYTTIIIIIVCVSLNRGIWYGSRDDYVEREEEESEWKEEERTILDELREN